MTAMSDVEASAWEERYREGRTRWERGRLHPAFAAWRKAGALNAEHVIVPGCGRSPELVEFAALATRVTGLDVVDSALEHQRRALAARGLEAQLEDVSLFDWKPRGIADLVYEQTCLCAFPPERHPAYERAVHTWLAPKGRLFALFMQVGHDGGPPFDCSLGDMRKLFPEERWSWPDPPFRVFDHPALEDAHELAVVLVKT